MGNYIIRKFVKDSENYENTDVRESYGVVVSVVGILANVLLFVIKLVVGVIIASVAVIADSFNNLLDAGSSVVGLIGFKLSNKPADREHPFGHGRIEYVAAFIISIIILLLGLEFLKSSVEKIFNPEDVKFSMISVLFLVFTMVVKLWLAAFNKKIGKKIDSDVMHATAQDSINDVFITFTTIISILINHFTGFIVDGFAGILVATILLYTGFSIAKDVLSSLIGAPVSKQFADTISSKIEEYEGVLGTHDLLVHNYGPNNIIASIHAEVPSNVSITKIHEIIDRIETEVGAELKILLVIHMDPIDIFDEKLKEIKQMVIHYIEENNLSLDAHDFTSVHTGNYINILFDLAFPHEYSKEEIEDVKKNISNEILKMNTEYRCNINDEYSYIEK